MTLPTKPLTLKFYMKERLRVYGSGRHRAFKRCIEKGRGLRFRDDVRLRAYAVNFRVLTFPLTNLFRYCAR